MNDATAKRLIGTPNQNRSALARTATGDTSHKKQRIHTPSCILEPLYKFWPDGIALDPCGSPDGLVVADRILCPENGEDGLTTPWVDRTFVNPPYRNLKDWMTKGREEWHREQVWLVPVRPHRKWWRDFAEKATCLIWLNPIAFDGYEQKFPAALCLFYLGPDVVRFCMHFHHLGGIA